MEQSNPRGADPDSVSLEQLLAENEHLRRRLSAAADRLEELESTVSAIQSGQVNAVVVDRREQPEVWTLETADRLHLSLVEQAARAGTWHCELASGAMTWSESLLRLYGLPPANTPSIELAHELVHPEDRERLWSAMQEAIRSEQEYYDEFRIIRPDGAVRWMATRARVIRGAVQDATWLAGITLDITERRLTEEALRQADRRKDEFLAMLAHELRNPLAAIANAIRLSQSPNLAASDRTWVEQTLMQQMELIGRLVDDLLDVARITRGRIELKQEPLRLRDLISRTVDTVRALFDRSQHQLSVNFPQEPVWVSADPARLQQILANLLTNAAKYTKENGRISVSVARDGADAEIVVKDNGIGISPEMLPRVFDLFAQAAQGLDRSQGGLGIGLTLVRRLVEMHGGSVEVASDGPGRGSEFTVRLPAIAPPATAAPASRLPAARPRQKLRILIVDDNEDAARTLALLLKSFGHETAMAFNGRQAIEIADRFLPVAALLDLGLPEINGFDLAIHLKRMHPQTLLVAISGYGQQEDRERSRQAGFAEHFIKPVKFDDLLEVLNTRATAAA